MDDLTTQQWLDQEDRRVSAYIRAHGCSLEYVFACSCPGTTPFCYTIGLFGLGHPELLVFGVEQGTAAGLLNHAFALVRGGRDLVPGELLTFEQSQTSWLVEDVPNPGDIVFAANRHYRRPAEHSVPVLQLTWSVHGDFPGDAGYCLGPHVQPRPGTFDAREPVDCECACDPDQCPGPR